MIDLDSLDGIDIIKGSSEFHTLAETASSTTVKPTFPSMSQKSSNLLSCMLITANVGTIFEESTLLELWFQQLKSYLTKIKPQFVAIHCQEVGGKNYESSMKHVSNFTDKIICDEAIVEHYTGVRIFLDENFENLEKFTALGSLYLIHDSIKNVKLYNFKTAQYDTIKGIEVYAGNSTDQVAEHIEKVKFPQDLFPECRWSRKGYMRTRWLFNDSQPLDLVNIHLFHDASNLVAMEVTPSPYAQNRRKALEYTLKRIALPLEGNDEQSQSQQNQSTSSSITTNQQLQHSGQTEVPLFIFGDFNFRLDTNKVIQRITAGVSPVVKRSADSNEVVEFIYHRRDDEKSSTSNKNNNHPSYMSRDSSIESPRKDDDGNSNYLFDGSEVVMTVGKKFFDCENLDATFRATKNTEWLQELDRELESFKSQLLEFKISFSPSYPFKEDTTGGYSYMKTRCPAWCDRILFNAAGCNMIFSDQLSSGTQLDSEKRLESLQEKGDILYRLMGNSVPMGDHKPVLLYCQLNLSPLSSAILNSSSSNSNCNNLRATNSNESSDLIESTTM